MITKKTFKQIKKGNIQALIDAIEELLDNYHSTPFDDGYKAGQEDLFVHAEPLAGFLHERAGDRIIRRGETEDIINEYFRGL